MSKSVPVAVRKPPVAGQNYTIPEFAQAMRVSPSYVYLELAKGRLFALKVGKRSIITSGEKTRYELSLEPLVSRAKPATGRSE